MLTKKEKITFAKNFSELIDWVEKYGFPSSESCFITEFQMFSRLAAIRKRPELLEEAKKLDTNKLIFKN